MSFDNGHALLVGVGAYQDPRYSVPITLQDAKDLADVLLDPAAAGYPSNQVHLLTGTTASRSGVLRALNALASTTRSDSTVLIFLCGHGEGTDDGGYNFLSADARRGPEGRFVSDSVISSGELVQTISAIPAQKLLLLFNTCFSGVIAGALEVQPSASVIGAPPPEDVVTAVLGSGEGRVVISACRREQQSNFDRNARNTLFTQALLEGLRGSPDVLSRRGYIGVFELYDYIFEAVHRDIKQLAPQLNQDPVITMREVVGAFPVALYRGGGYAGRLSPEDDLRLQQKPMTGEVKVVPTIQAKRVFTQVVNRTLIRGNANYGSVAGPAVLGNVGGNANLGAGAQFNNQGMQVGGANYQGNTINAAGDFVGGNQTRGDSITVGNISGSSGIAVGRGARASVMHGASGDADALARAFATIYAAIEARPVRATDAFDKDDITQAVQQTQAEAGKGEQADGGRVEKLLRRVSAMAPDIGEVVAATLASPLAGVATVVRLVAEKARAGTGPAPTAGGDS